MCVDVGFAGFPVEIQKERNMSKTLLIRHAVGQILKEQREQSKLSQREVARTAGVALGYLSEIERGIKEPSSEMVRSICQALLFDSADLLVEAGMRMKEHELSLLQQTSCS
jgi:transcriptional regulator with XRE-family HTH domain